MLGPVTGLTQTGQAPPATTFAWNPDYEADFYLIGVDSGAPVQVPAADATVIAAAGGHTLKVAPGLVATVPTTLSFTVDTPPPPPPAKGGNMVPVLAGAAVLAVAALAVSRQKRRR